MKKWREKGLRSSLEAYFCNFPKHQKCLRTLGKLETDLHRKNCMFLGIFKSMVKKAVIRNIDTEIHYVKPLPLNKYQVTGAFAKY